MMKPCLGQLDDGAWVHWGGRFVELRVAVVVVGEVVQAVAVGHGHRSAQACGH